MTLITQTVSRRLRRAFQGDICWSNCPNRENVRLHHLGENKVVKLCIPCTEHLIYNGEDPERLDRISIQAF